MHQDIRSLHYPCALWSWSSFSCCHGIVASTALAIVALMMQRYLRMWSAERLLHDSHQVLRPWWRLWVNRSADPFLNIFASSLVAALLVPSPYHLGAGAAIVWSSFGVVVMATHCNCSFDDARVFIDVISREVAWWPPSGPKALVEIVNQPLCWSILEHFCIITCGCILWVPCMPLPLGAGLAEREACASLGPMAR